MLLITNARSASYYGGSGSGPSRRARPLSGGAPPGSKGSKNFAARVSEITAKRAAKTPVEVWFQDEMRLGQKNPRTRRWARRGTRPRAIADLRTRSAYLLGAICPKRGTGAAVVMPKADMQA